MIVITEARVNDAIVRSERTLDNPGFCLACGEERQSVEVDAVKYECYTCGEKESVYGLMHISSILIRRANA